MYLVCILDVSNKCEDCVRNQTALYRRHTHLGGQEQADIDALPEGTWWVKTQEGSRRHVCNFHRFDYE